MSPWAANAVAIGFFAIVLTAYATTAVWRASAWNLRPSEVLNSREGLALGARAPSLTGYGADGSEVDLAFLGGFTFLVFGTAECVPCRKLVDSASFHPATRGMRRIYASGDGGLPTERGVSAYWEAYKFHDESSQREQWNAPVSPYFHVIDQKGRVRAKGIGSADSHLDRLLSIHPSRL